MGNGKWVVCVCVCVFVLEWEAGVCRKHRRLAIIGRSRSVPCSVSSAIEGQIGFNLCIFFSALISPPPRGGGGLCFVKLLISLTKGPIRRCP
uniref:Putative secreted protein n=1 Tax=Anopheles marajoara TaxID=58244 RepID=A0A2M4C9T2_9DIPT